MLIKKLEKCKLEQNFSLISNVVDKIELFSIADLLKLVQSTTDQVNDFKQELNLFCGNVAKKMAYIIAIKEFTSMFDEFKKSNESEINNALQVLAKYDKYNKDQKIADFISDNTTHLGNLQKANKQVVNLSKAKLSQSYKFLGVTASVTNIEIMSASKVIIQDFSSDNFSKLIEELNITLKEVLRILAIQKDVFTVLFNKKTLRQTFEKKAKPGEIDFLIQEVQTLKSILLPLEQRAFSFVSQKIEAEVAAAQNYIKSTLKPIYMWLNTSIEPKMKQVRNKVWTLDSESNDALLAKVIAVLDLKPYHKIYLLLSPVLSKMSKFDIEEELQLPVAL